MKHLVALVCVSLLVLAGCDRSPMGVSEDGLQLELSARQDHVSGSVDVSLPCMPGCDRSGGTLEVNAHGNEARTWGNIKWTAYDKLGNVARTMRWDVTAATFDPQAGTASFVGVVTEDSSVPDSRLGHYYEFYAEDNGSPGTDGDLIKWADRVSEPAGFDPGSLTTFPIVDGNLTIK